METKIDSIIWINNLLFFCPTCISQLKKLYRTKFWSQSVPHPARSLRFIHEAQMSSNILDD